MDTAHAKGKDADSADVTGTSADPIRDSGVDSGPNFAEFQEAEWSGTTVSHLPGNRCVVPR